MAVAMKSCWASGSSHRLVEHERVWTLANASCACYLTPGDQLSSTTDGSRMGHEAMFECPLGP
jgi:hypothetical protein